jgi:hypothetical protein
MYILTVDGINLSTMPGKKLRARKATAEIGFTEVTTNFTANAVKLIAKEVSKN